MRRNVLQDCSYAYLSIIDIYIFTAYHFMEHMIALIYLLLSELRFWG